MINMSKRFKILGEYVWLILVQYNDILLHIKKKSKSGIKVWLLKGPTFYVELLTAVQVHVNEKLLFKGKYT